MEQDNERLAARALLYRLAQSLLSEPPTRDSVELALSGLVEEALEKSGVVLADARCLESARNTFITAPEEFTSEIDGQYQRLFYQPGKLPCPPWESSYVSGERKVFQQSTLDVRKAYQAQGLRPRAVNRIPDDHIAIELGFMAELAKRTQSEDSDVSKQSLHASASFLSNHLANWIDSYAEDVASAAAVPFFACVCAAIRDFIHEDMRFVVEQLSRLQATSAEVVLA